MKTLSLIAFPALLSLALARPLPAPPQVAPAAGDAVLARILELGEKDNRVQEHLKTLCKTIGPRLTGTARYDQAAQWAAQQFRSFGLDARLEQWGEFPTAFERGYASGGMVAPQEIDYTFLTSAWSPGTGGPKRGPAILQPSTEAALEAVKARLGGAWIVSADPPPSGKVGREVREACEAAGVLGFVRPGSRNGRLHMGGNQRVEAEKPPRQVQIQLLNVQYDDLKHRLEAGEVVELEFDVRNVLSPGPVPCCNVVADLKGTEHPDEYVVLGGHLDSWDAAEGAQDNGTGSAVTIEAARLVSAAGGRPRRTIRFVLFGGEEEGLLGSAGYIKAHKDEMEKTSLALIHDTGGTAVLSLGANYSMLDDFERVFAPVKALHPAFPFRVEETDGLENSGDSDHAPFLQAGVPGFIWKQSERGYERVHHTQFDVFESVDPAQEQHSALVAAVAAWGFAELDHLLDRTDMKAAERRRMGVSLDGTTVRSVFKDSQASAAGWKDGDVILSIDGADVKDRDAITDLLRQGAPKKAFRLKRGEAVVESTLDWSNEPSEKERGERAQRREAWRRAHSTR
jgi:carboxypeptidase Q